MTRQLIWTLMPFFSFLLSDGIRHLRNADERTRLITFSVEVYPTISIHRRVKESRQGLEKEEGLPPSDAFPFIIFVL